MKHTIATTKIEGVTYEDYLDFCSANGVEPSEDDYYNWAREETEVNFEEDLLMIGQYEPYNMPVVICGTLGLWDGRHKIVPVRAESVRQAIERICGRDTDDLEVIWEDGVIMIYEHHHDGVNIFEVSALNKKGLAKKSADYKPHDVKKLPYLYD